MSTACSQAVLLVKGADDVMQKLTAEPAAFPEALATSSGLLGRQDHLRRFAKQGLRTLVLGRRFVRADELYGWHEDYVTAQSSMQERLKTSRLDLFAS